PNDTIELTYAYIFGRDYQKTGAEAGVDNMLMRADTIRSYFNQGLLNPCIETASGKKPNIPISKFLLFPNPTQSHLFIVQNGNESLTITVYDITGKILFTKVSGSVKTRINLAGYPKGTYAAHIEGSNYSEKKLFVIK
ncbi:MAG: T9SS type A sorting domain-containing protein, partial [Salibacteraceae bacterium]